MNAAAAGIAALAARIEAALPQTQCTRCGYPDCAAYAEAIADGRAGIDRCPPGGTEGVARLARITGRAVLPLDPAHGVEAPRALAVIDEDWCIGCTLCLDACPTDAILGRAKRMHTVIAPHCTGCELCLPVCPVDCIRLENASGTATGWAAWSLSQADAALARYRARTARRAGGPGLAAAEREGDGAATGHPGADAQAAPTADRKRAAIAAALERARRAAAGRQAG